MTTDLGKITIPVELQPVVGQLEHTAEDQYASFAKREPVVLGHLLTAPVAASLSYLVEHGVIGASTASDKQSSLIAGGVFVLITIQGFVMRRYVTPAWKKATGRELPIVTPDPAIYSDAYDDGTGVPAPAKPPASRDEDHVAEHAAPAEA